MKKALLTLSALALCMAAGSALAKEYKELRFGVDPSYAPFESKAADGSLVLLRHDGGELARLPARLTHVDPNESKAA